LALVAVTGAILRLRGLDASCLWLDEVLTAEAARRGPGFILKFTIGDTGPLPLSYLFECLTVRLGEGETWVRMPTALFGAAAPLLAAWVALLLTRSRMTGLLAAFLLAVNDHHLYFSREARGYALLVFVTLLSYGLLLSAMRSPRARWWWVGFAGASVAGLYTSYFFIFAWGAMLIDAAVRLSRAVLNRAGGADDCRARRRAVLRRALVLILCATVCGLLFLPWVVHAREALQEYRQAFASANKPGFVRVWLESVAAAWTLAPADARAPIFAWWAALALGVVADLLRRGSRGLLTLLVGANIALPAAAFHLYPPGHFLAERYLIAALPFMLILIAGGAGSLLDLAWRRALRPRRDFLRLAVAGLLSTVVAVPLALYTRTQLQHYRSWATAQKQDWRTVAEFLQAHLQPGDMILPSPNNTNVCLHYYLPPELEPLIAPKQAGEPAYLGEFTNRTLQARRRIWYIAPDYTLWEMPGLAAWLDEYFRREKVVPGRSTVTIFLGPFANETDKGRPSGRQSP
jgi:hypothetical protein